MDCEQRNVIIKLIDNLFDYYKSSRNSTNNRRAEVQSRTVCGMLDAFSKGEENEGFSFSLDLRIGEELRYLSFFLDNNCIEISQGGSVYDQNVGSDSYTSWNYRLWDSGESEGDLLLDFSDIMEMINLGAEIVFNWPEELIVENLSAEIANDKEKEFLDTLKSSYECLMARLAEPIVNRLVGKIRRQLQSFDRKSSMMLSGENSGLLNVWNELCVQVQGEKSAFYDSYIDIIESMISDMLNECTKDEIIILWTQTQDYEDWTANQDSIEYDYSDLLESEYNVDAVCEYLMDEVENAACNYSSKRIGDYLYQAEME